MLERLRKHLHDLPTLWDAFNTKENDPTLDRFGAAIQALHTFESIRYPDEIARHGMATGVSWAPGDISFEGGTMPLPPKYIVHMNEIDELVVEILKRAANPKAIRAGNSLAREALQFQNPFAAVWGL
jgi:hypothetical protein